MNSKNLIPILVGVYLLGFVSAAVVGKVVISKKPLFKKILKKFEDRRIARIPQKKKALVINNFEKKKDLHPWKTKLADLSLSKEHVFFGKKSAKVTFKKGGEVAQIQMASMFKKQKKWSNWEGYDAFTLDVFNPHESKVPVFLKIKDKSGGTYSQKVYLNPNSKDQFYVDISSLRGRLNPGKIDQVSLFIWEPKNTKTLYIDNARLIPANSFEKDEMVILKSEYLPKKNEKAYATGDFFDFSKKRQSWMKEGVIEVPININNQSAWGKKDFPVSGGIPFPKGELKSVNSVKILNPLREEISAQLRPLGYWNDKSIKWLLVDTKFDVPINNKMSGLIQYGANKNKKNKFPSKLKVKETSKEITVNTGPMKFSIKKDGFRLLDAVWIDRNADGAFAKDELISSGSDLVIEHNGKQFRSSLDKRSIITVEDNGPLKTTIKAEGWFVSKKKKKFCKFIVRLQAFEGQDFVKVFHTFVFTGYPENKHHYLYKGKRLPKNETIEAVYIETNFNLTDGLQYNFGADNESLRAHLKEDIHIYQKSSDQFTVRGLKNDITKGKRLDGWLDVTDGQKGIAVVMKSLWEQYPKGWQVLKDKKKLKTLIWPSSAGELDLKTTGAAAGEDAVARGSAFGLAKTHELALYFHNGPLNKEVGWNVVQLLKQPLLLSASPQWVSDTVAIGKIAPANQRTLLMEKSIEALFAWTTRHINDNKWYGMINFGDTLSLHRHGSWNPDGRWGWMNNEAMGVHSGLLMQYLRSGKNAYFILGENNARHIMDVDTVHYNTVANDKRLKNVISDDYSQPGSMHRHNADHWGGRNEETSHTNLHGILLYYYMTGYERAFDVAKEIGEFFLKERITYFKHPDIAPQRNISNLLWGVTEMYEATQDIRYKKTADKWADVLYKGQMHNGTWLETYNPKARRWNGKEHTLYTVNYTLPALIAYHQQTQNKAIAQTITRATDFYTKRKIYNPIFEAMYYSYYLTGDVKYLNAAGERLDFFMKSQKYSEDPLKNGMIYQKPFYFRAVEFFYQFPFAFEPSIKKQEVKK